MSRRAFGPNVSYVAMPANRLSWLFENKSVVFRNRMTFAYTGASRIGAERTDRWITEVLALVDDVDDALEALEAAGTKASARGVLGALGLAIVGVG